jgi:transposase-like protein
MTCYQEITCPQCGGNDIAKSGLSAHNVQRYRCRYPDCPTKTFMPDYRYRAYGPGIKAQVVEMAIHSSGIRDTARALKINLNTVISTLKKSLRTGASEPVVPQGHRETAGSAAGTGLP